MGPEKTGRGGAEARRKEGGWMGFPIDLPAGARTLSADEAKVMAAMR
ncbi:MAG TPA: hypothetical protein VME43_30755 [Bryobacteraceae bacterium]|nr:hypothetical protein [Bryobacteraceae bacterium]